MHLLKWLFGDVEYPTYEDLEEELADLRVAFKELHDDYNELGDKYTNVFADREALQINLNCARANEKKIVESVVRAERDLAHYRTIIRQIGDVLEKYGCS